MTSEFGDIMQLGYIVEDVPAAARQWSEQLGIGPFYVIDRQPMPEYYYRGKHTELEMCLAFGYWGTMQVELITPLNDADHLYTRALADAPGRLNHYATMVTDLDKLLADYKLEDRIVQSGKMPTGIKFVYLEEYLPGGFHLELVQAHEATQQAYAGMQAVASKWDGKDLIRPITRLGEDIAALQAG